MQHHVNTVKAASLYSDEALAQNTREDEEDWLEDKVTEYRDNDVRQPSEHTKTISNASKSCFSPIPAKTVNSNTRHSCTPTAVAASHEHPDPFRLSVERNTVTQQKCAQANARFHSAARQLASLPLSPPPPLQRVNRQLRARTPAKHKLQATKHHDDHRRLKQSGSPRKLLWPTTNSISSNGELRHVESNSHVLTQQPHVQRPKRSFVVHRSPILKHRSNPHVSPQSAQTSERPKRGVRLNVPTAAAISSRHATVTRGTRRLVVRAEEIPEKLTTSSPESISPKNTAGENVAAPESEKSSTTGIELGEILHDMETAVDSELAIATAPVSGDLQQSKNSPDLRFYAARILPQWHIWTCRGIFGVFVITANVSLLLAYLNTDRHLYLLAILAFMKSKDLLSTIADILGLILNVVYGAFKPPKPATSGWILSLVCAYAETEEQILKTVRSLAEQELNPHKQVICIILDGKHADILSRFSKVHHKLTRSYFTWKGSTGNVLIHSGSLLGTPTILIKKARNAGKKDSLILGHDIFNYPRSDMPRDTLLLRRELFSRVIPTLTGDEQLSSFDFVFCTDADSTIHPQSLRELANTLQRNESSIAACGILVAELAAPEVEWSIWHLYQQFQYTFGQYIRRQAEGLWGRITCLPGCITMIKVRPEMGAAISMYAHPVTNYNILEHQVQYLGTDRRLTYCILAQGKHLKSFFVPGALCETVVPDSLEHYLSQRRRWASNAYFNDYYYAGGRNQIFVTRLFATIDIVRQTLVFYRVINTALFIMSLTQRFYIAKIIPTLILTKAPATWFMLLVLVREKVLRQRVHKLVLGMCINQFISPLLSVIVFANVLLNMGSQVWGTTGVSSIDPRHPATPYVALPPSEPIWSPTRLASIVKTAINGVGSQQRSNSCPAATQTMVQPPDLGRSRAASVPCTPGSKAAFVASSALTLSEIRLRTPARPLSQD